MKSLLATLASGQVLISDGAWGTLLHQRGLKLGECPELWNINHRSDVASVAKGYIDAGADIILTNSFGANPQKLTHYGLADRTAELNEAAAAISREAAGTDHFVLGSMGPTGAILMMGEVSEEELYNGFRIQSQALERGGVDAVCIETMSAIDEACIAIRAVKESTSLEIACTFTFDKTACDEYRTMMGVSPTDMVKAIKTAGASIVGANCGNGFDGMIDIVKEIRLVDSTIPVLIHANAGRPTVENGHTVFPETPEDMAARVLDLVDAGVNIIGGCCGTTPAHIAAIGQKVRCR